MSRRSVALIRRRSRACARAAATFTGRPHMRDKGGHRVPLPAWRSHAEGLASPTLWLALCVAQQCRDGGEGKLDASVLLRLRHMASRSGEGLAAKGHRSNVRKSQLARTATCLREASGPEKIGCHESRDEEHGCLCCARARDAAIAGSRGRGNDMNANAEAQTPIWQLVLRSPLFRLIVLGAAMLQFMG